ncbi:hypothetical protein, partial [uncultured Lamprocystis sp.]|uniref:hypothetical protein n=1 Tax=uncultured Lamprocystis sp. TaxID=543132 RepID=UPI0025D863EF
GVRESHGEPHRQALIKALGLLLLCRIFTSEAYATFRRCHGAIFFLCNSPILLFLKNYATY